MLEALVVVPKSGQPAPGSSVRRKGRALLLCPRAMGQQDSRRRTRPGLGVSYSYSFSSRFPQAVTPGPAFIPNPGASCAKHSPSSSSPWTPGYHPSGCRRGAQLPSGVGCVRWNWFSGGSSWQSWLSLLSEEQQRCFSVWASHGKSPSGQTLSLFPGTRNWPGRMRNSCLCTALKPALPKSPVLGIDNYESWSHEKARGVGTPVACKKCSLKV